MAESHILQNFLSPPVLFFFLGLLAALARSDLEIPQPLAKFFSLYLLMAIGFKGGIDNTKGSPISSDLALSCHLAGANPAQVTASHGPVIQPCSQSGNTLIDA